MMDVRIVSSTNSAVPPEAGSHCKPEIAPRQGKAAGMRRVAQRNTNAGFSVVLYHGSGKK
jgi:hypothetical protein